MTHALKKIEDYRGVVQDSVIDEITTKASDLRGASVVHVNATSYGGGGGGILGNFVLLMNDLGITQHGRFQT